MVLPNGVLALLLVEALAHVVDVSFASELYIARLPPYSSIPPPVVQERPMQHQHVGNTVCVP